MIKSMTGYGRSTVEKNGRNITVEVKSVNHRFFDFNLRIYRIYSQFEDKIKSIVQQRISRGKIEVFVSIINTTDNSIEVELDKALLNGYLKALNTISDEYNLKNDISVMSITRFNDIFSVKKTEADEDEIWEHLSEVLNLALDEFVKMRLDEGQRLKKDLFLYCDNLTEGVNYLEKRSPETVLIYKEKLYDKMKELLGDVKVDEQRLLTETAIFADKIAVDEEMTRLRSHIVQFKEMLECQNAIGKKMDFLIQEMNREINTTGSKSSDLTMSQTVINMKSELEKIREQIQNIE